MKWALIPIFCAMAAPAPSLAEALLAVHNRERALVGVPLVAWDPRLAAAAAPWARHLAEIGRLEHSPAGTRAGSGENLAMGTQGFYSPADLARGWAAEKSDFVRK